MVKITKHNGTANGLEHTTTPNSSTTTDNNYFGDYTTSFAQTTSRYETSIEKTIELRNDFISCLKSQIELLLKVKVSGVVGNNLIATNIYGVFRIHTSKEERK